MFAIVCSFPSNVNIPLLMTIIPCLLPPPSTESILTYWIHQGCSQFKLSTQVRIIMTIFEKALVIFTQTLYFSFFYIQRQWLKLESCLLLLLYFCHLWIFIPILFYFSVLEDGGERLSIISLSNKTLKFGWKNSKAKL